MYPVFSNPIPIALFLSNMNGVGGGGGCFISNEKNIVKGKTSPPPFHTTNKIEASIFFGNPVYYIAGTNMNETPV